MEAKPQKENLSSDTNARLSVLENNVDIVTQKVDKLETKMENNYATLHHRISEMRDDLRMDFENKNEKIINKLEEHNHNSVIQSTLLQDKINRLEKWRWFIMGGAAVVGYMIAHIKIDKLF